MIRCAIIEDEEDSRDLMIILLGRYCKDVEVVGTAASVKEAVDLINLWRPELVFMDIEIEGGNSFEIFEQISYTKVSVIFTTAYDHFAIKAFKFSAIDYLLKPLNFEELIDAVRKFRESRTFEIDESYVEYKSNLPRRNSESLIIPSITGFKVYKLNEIKWLRSDKSYTTFKISDEIVVASKPIGYFEELLPSGMYYRIHNRIVVNLSYIREYLKGGVVVLSDGEELTVSHKRKEGLVKVLNS